MGSSRTLLALIGARHVLLVLGVLFPGVEGIGATEESAPKQGVRSSTPTGFEEQVLPILTMHCLECHGLEAREANLDLRTLGLVIKGGDGGAAVVPGDAEKSLLFERIADGSMPPEKELPLSGAKIARIRAWIERDSIKDARSVASAEENSPVAASDRDFWAFRKLEPVTVPQVERRDRVRTPVDAFILASLEAKGLTLSDDADRSTLVRRLHLDLIGIPPSPEEVSAFGADDSPTAYERLVDRLLESPHFGERWGRHWLDAAGYCDVIGDDTDRDIIKAPAGKWLYRDWVVRALNADKPFDRFLVEQLAGDELIDWRSAEKYTSRIRDLLIATGFLRTAPDETLQNELNTADIRHEVLSQTVEVVASNLLGLTVNCARCHSHKYDPVPQEDYYRLIALFTPAYNPASWLQPAQRELPDVSPTKKKAIDGHNAKIDAQVAECNARIEAIRKPHRERLFDRKLKTLPEPIRGDTAAAIRTAPEKRDEIQKYLAAKFAAALKVGPPEVEQALSTEEKGQVAALTRSIGESKSQRRGYGKLQAVYDVGAPPPTYLLRRGNHQTPGKEVEPGFLRVLCDSDAGALAKDQAPYGGASGRRLALAGWLTKPNGRAGALVARVFVNRTWQHLFGRGIVSTSDNFGTSGTAPTHPALLDWLAGRFVADGWSVKSLVRQTVLSSAYRQRSVAAMAHAEQRETNGLASTVDPDNDLLWRMRLRQLDSEIVRDSVLAVSGQLDLGVGGPPVGVTNQPDGSVVITEKGNPNRRSLYVLSRRRYNLSVLDVFDQPEMSRNCARRSPSAVVTQSLALLNDRFWSENGERLAERVASQSDPITGEWTEAIGAAYSTTLARPPRDREIRWATELLERQVARYRDAEQSPETAATKALTHLCHMLLCSNEFLYTP